MKKIILLAVVLIVSTGCRQDRQARALITPGIADGDLLLAMSGTTEQLLRHHQIDLHRQIKTTDRITIDVWVMLARMPQADCPRLGTALLIHDLGDSKIVNLPLAGRLAKMGFDVVMPDLRAHGRSSGEFFTYGLKESQDLKTVITKLEAEGIIKPPVYVYGDQMGGMTAIHYAASDDRCAGVLVSRPFKDFRTAALRRIILSATFMNPRQFEHLIQRAGDIGGFEPDKSSVVEAAKKLHCPLVLVHRLADIVVPIDNSRAIAESAGGPVRLITIIPAMEEAILVLLWDNWLADRMMELTAKPTEPASQD